MTISPKSKSTNPKRTRSFKSIPDSEREGVQKAAEELLTAILVQIVTDASAIRVTSKWEEDELHLLIDVASADRGRVIGKKGYNIHAIRNLFSVVSLAQRCTILPDLLD